MTTAYVEQRSQPAKGTFPRQGPDAYVAVQIVPDGAKRLQSLNYAAAKRRGIEIRHMGEGYSTRTGARSMLGKALAAAAELAAEINATV